MGVAEGDGLDVGCSRTGCANIRLDENTIEKNSGTGPILDTPHRVSKNPETQSACHSPNECGRFAINQPTSMKTNDARAQPEVATMIVKATASKRNSRCISRRKYSPVSQCGARLPEGSPRFQPNIAWPKGSRGPDWKRCSIKGAVLRHGSILR